MVAGFLAGVPAARQPDTPWLYLYHTAFGAVVRLYAGARAGAHLPAITQRRHAGHNNGSSAPFALDPFWFWTWAPLPLRGSHLLRSRICSSTFFYPTATLRHLPAPATATSCLHGYIPHTVVPLDSIVSFGLRRHSTFFSWILFFGGGSLVTFVTNSVH